MEIPRDSLVVAILRSIAHGNITSTTLSLGKINLSIYDIIVHFNCSTSSLEWFRPNKLSNVNKLRNRGLILFCVLPLPILRTEHQFQSKLLSYFGGICKKTENYSGEAAVKIQCLILRMNAEPIWLLLGMGIAYTYGTVVSTVLCCVDIIITIHVRFKKKFEIYTGSDSSRT